MSSAGQTRVQPRAGGTSRTNAEITLRGLVVARWVLLALASLLVVLVALWGVGLPAGLIPRSDYGLGVGLTLVAWLGLNLLSIVILRRGRASEGAAGLHLVVDALALTALLALSGGPANPFTILYFLPITLATQVSPRWTWALAGSCTACFAALFVLTPAPELAAVSEPAQLEHTSATPEHGAHAHGAHAHAEADAGSETPQLQEHAAVSGAPHAGHDFEGHQRGMWVAFGIAGVLMTIFVHRTALALAAQREELARLRRETLEDRHVTALGTLAAGAAHELGTPLATVKLLVDELPHFDGSELGAARETMSQELARCKGILARMASPELRVEALGGGEPWRLRTLLAALEGPVLGVPLEQRVPQGLGELRCSQPFEALAQLLRELLSNAAQATRRGAQPYETIELELRALSSERVLIEIRDHGVGMDEHTRAAAFDPFHTTREAGAGMGLGLYLARAHLRQLGGQIELESTPRQGTRVRVELPMMYGEGGS